MLEKLQQDTFGYFFYEMNPDNTRGESPCSIAVVGLALAAYTVAVERSRPCAFSGS